MGQGGGGGGAVINGAVSEPYVSVIKTGNGPRSIVLPPNHFFSLVPLLFQSWDSCSIAPGFCQYWKGLLLFFCFVLCFAVGSPLESGCVALGFLFSDFLHFLCIAFAILDQYNPFLKTSLCTAPWWPCALQAMQARPPARVCSTLIWVTRLHLGR